jgi:hypothetical protein
MKTLSAAFLTMMLLGAVLARRRALGFDLSAAFTPICVRCIRFRFWKVEICSQRDLTRFIRRLEPLVSSGILSVVQSSQSLAEIRDRPFGGYVILCVRCSRCEREFQLIGDIERGVRWSR